jgi:twitching motility protein PilT
MADAPQGGVRPEEASPSSWQSRPAAGGGTGAPSGAPRFKPSIPSNGATGAAAPASGGFNSPAPPGAQPPQAEPQVTNLQDYFVGKAKQLTRGELHAIEDLHVDELLHTVVEKNASDLHIAAGIPPIIREQGALVPLPFERMAPNETQRMMYDILTDEQIQRFESTWELDFAYALGKKARFRVNIFRDRGNVAGALRLIPTKIPTLEQLGYVRKLEELTHLRRGLILVTGPTGSGKSTTLAAMIDSINTGRSEHVITIEDPIEYLHPHKKSIVNQRELGMDTKEFSNALRASLREDPDVILVGEMRDLETMRLAISAAETGHLVFATLHTNSAASTVDRIVDAFPQGQQEQIRLQLSNNLQAVICQTLIPRLGDTGRIGVQEIMIATPAIRNLIREAKAHQITSIIQTSAQVGMITMDQNLRDHYQRGLISYDDAVSRAINPDELKRMIAAPESTTMQAPPQFAGAGGQMPPGGMPPQGPPPGMRPPGR